MEGESELSRNKHRITHIPSHHSGTFNICTFTNEINHPSKSIKLGLINVQSTKNKAFLIHDYIIDNKVNLTVLTKTWLVNINRDSIWIQNTDLNKDHLSMLVHNREDNSGGGLVLIYNNPVLDPNVLLKGCVEI